ncbi:MAG: phosphoribosylglycinamide formyltransferase [Bacillota bacterium]
MVNTAIFASGRGTNLENIINRAASGDLEIEPKLVHVDRKGTGAETKAKQAEIPVYRSQPESFKDRLGYEADLLNKLEELEIELIVLAGYLRILSPRFVSKYPQQIINTHPSLLPAFPGLNGPTQALQAGVKITGATVHYVTAELDAGPIICQKAVEVEKEDTITTLTAKIKEVEYQILPQAIREHIET